MELDGLMIQAGHALAINVILYGIPRKQSPVQLTISSSLNIIANTNINKRAVDFDIVYLKENRSTLECGAQKLLHRISMYWCIAKQLVDNTEVQV